MRVSIGAGIRMPEVIDCSSYDLYTAFGHFPWRSRARKESSIISTGLSYATVMWLVIGRLKFSHVIE
ncbi:hypothetical protein BHM03_00048352 [Ensete ventricosum]|nr:hypothetical protein BHM03_00048352 [Ensete ventricosum]